MRVCTKYGIGKEEEDFYWQVKNVNKRSACKKCTLVQNKEYTQTEEGRTLWEKYIKSDEYKASQKKHAKTDKRKASYAKHAKTDKGRATTKKSDAKRRAKELAEVNTLTPEQWGQINEKQDHKCAGCQESFTEENPATEDHIIPVGEGPGRTEGNIQALCLSCNCIKGPAQWNIYLKD